MLALSRTTAVSGSASWVTDEPISLTVWPPHSSMKSRCRHRLSRFPASPCGALGFRRRRGLVRFGGLFRGLLDGGAGRFWLLYRL